MNALKALAIGLLFLGQAAFAQDVFTYKNPLLVQQSETGDYCPKILNVTALNERGSLQGKAVSLVASRGAAGVFNYSYTSHNCISDMICLSEHHYTKEGVMVEIMLRLNNDGAYPTTDLPGYSAVEVDLLTPTQRKSCVYMLN